MRVGGDGAGRRQGEDEPAGRVIQHGGEDVRVGEEEVRRRPRFRHVERIGTSTELQMLGLPVVREAAVEVQPPVGRGHREVGTDGSFDHPLLDQLVAFPLRCLGVAPEHDPRIETGDAPLATGIADAHDGDFPIAVDIFRVQTGLPDGRRPGDRGAPEPVRRRQVHLRAIG